MWGSVVIFRNREGPRAKLVENTALVNSDGSFHINRLLDSLYEIKTPGVGITSVGGVVSATKPIAGFS